MKRYTQKDIKELANILRENAIISVPTDTVYGLCGRINSVEAYNKIMKIKNRPITKSLPVMCADEDQIKSIAIVDENVQKLIEAFMPGPITLVLKKRQDVLTNNKGTINTPEIAVRMAPTKFLKELIGELNSPIFMTSANKSGKAECRTLDEIEKSCPELDGIVEGKVSFEKASTIIDCTVNPVKIIREGPILEKQIMEILKNK